MLTTKYQDFLAGAEGPHSRSAWSFPTSPARTACRSSTSSRRRRTRPNFNYAFIHAGAGARVQFTPSLDIDLGAGYLIVTNLGLATSEVEVADALPERDGATAST